jgi:hypothetical protein
MTKAKNTNLVILNTEARAIELLPVPSKEATPEEMLGKVLLPGENDLTQVAWDHCKKSKAIRMWIECGYLEEKGEGKAQSLGEGLDGLTAREATTKIGSCDKVKILQDWKDKTTKRTLIKLINTRIDSLIKESGKEE